MKKLIIYLATAAFAINVAQALAQSIALPAETGTKLITLGTLGGPVPKSNRAQSSNLLMVDGTPYLIDAGDGVTRRISETKVDPRKLAAIFVTHHHDDHTAGLGTLMASLWDANRTKPIEVYGPPRTEELVKATVAYFRISAALRIADGGRSVPIEKVFVGHDVPPGLVYQDDKVKVIAAENSHFDFHKTSQGTKSYAYRFETRDRVVVFTGDTGPSSAVAALAKGADLLVTDTSSFDDRVELMKSTGQWQAMSPAEQEGMRRQGGHGHMTMKEIGELATRAGVKAVVLSHVTFRADDDYSAHAAEVGRYYKGRIFVAKDLDTF